MVNSEQSNFEDPQLPLFEKPVDSPESTVQPDLAVDNRPSRSVYPPDEDKEEEGIRNTAWGGLGGHKHILTNDQAIALVSSGLGGREARDQVRAIARQQIDRAQGLTGPVERTPEETARIKDLVALAALNHDEALRTIEGVSEAKIAALRRARESRRNNQ